MDFSLLIEYGWVLLILIVLEGLLAADNALVLAILVKHLPEEERKKALFYGLAGAFVFRLGSIFAISLLVGVWQVQAIGAMYLIFIALNYLYKKYVKYQVEDSQEEEKKLGKGSGFWMTVLKVELADIAFAVDSILAAFAIALTLPATSLPPIGGIDGGKFLVVFLGGFIGLVIMRFAATFFVKLLQRRPGLETAAFLIVGWVGVKLAVYTLSHPTLGVLPEHIEELKAWKITFYAVLILIAVAGWFLSKEVDSEEEESKLEMDQGVSKDI
ncbi:TerC family protein [Caldalkalibacillus salinus]|uniref:TerC family protein n=1 Tax=Caldalkalibacillus salinus TaxID=2803787 RepID=UPI0019209761|nr:TerC family protein [Caldalkalibacillus salinus]